MNFLQTGTAILAITLLAGCSWVDSTGNQSGQALSGGPLVVLNDGDSFSANEGTRRKVVLGGSSAFVAEWDWQLLDGQGNIDSCLRFNGFSSEITSNSLSQTCQPGNDCKIRIDESVVNGVTQFDFVVPPMRAPAALAFKATATNTDGSPLEVRQTLCALSINEAPIAADDRYVLAQGSDLDVEGQDDNSLRANDTDDSDIRNSYLRVVEIPVVRPRYAAYFKIYEDGGFYYEPRSDVPLSVSGSISDSFVYAVTDGTHTVNATATIKVVEFNNPPEQYYDLPDIELDLDELDDEEFHIDFSNDFGDIDSDELWYSVETGSLPESGNLYMSGSGQLRGWPGVEDVGEYDITVKVTDAMTTIKDSFTLAIVRRAENNAPDAMDIKNRTVSGSFSYDVSVFFSDEDGDELNFSAAGLPSGVTISSDGVIKGKSSSANRGSYIIAVTAKDGYGGSALDRFRLRIR